MIEFYKDPLLPYRVGGLLYIPALNEGMAKKITSGAIPDLCSVAFCLEDSILDSAVASAECRLIETLSELGKAGCNLPLIFVRVRSPQHLFHVHGLLGGLEELLTGYIFPKFDLYNSDAYLETLSDINSIRHQKLLAMPILESSSIGRAETRKETLVALREMLGFQRESVLNIRVGGNDFCSQFGIRRGPDQTIYEASVVRDALSDIVNIFGHDYIVSGPVWEYYEGSKNDNRWREGLQMELRLDALNGFVGKTAIHPSQLPIIREALKVTEEDLQDARRIVAWEDPVKGVQAGYLHDRMNEIKCHSRWANKIISLAEVYGVRE